MTKTGEFNAKTPCEFCGDPSVLIDQHDCYVCARHSHDDRGDVKQASRGPDGKPKSNPVGWTETIRDAGAQ